MAASLTKTLSTFSVKKNCSEEPIKNMVAMETVRNGEDWNVQRHISSKFI